MRGAIAAGTGTPAIGTEESFNELLLRGLADASVLCAGDIDEEGDSGEGGRSEAEAE